MLTNVLILPMIFEQWIDYRSLLNVIKLFLQRNSGWQDVVPDDRNDILRRNRHRGQFPRARASRHHRQHHQVCNGPFYWADCFFLELVQRSSLVVRWDIFEKGVMAEWIECLAMETEFVGSNPGQCDLVYLGFFLLPSSSFPAMCSLFHTTPVGMRIRVLWLYGQFMGKG